jgi:decaprenylphospho-beta-D-erythro-pentofuranosid-2-ulose 2-reductase
VEARVPHAIIFGAASEIAQEIGRQLARDGWDLSLVARNPEQLKILQSELLIYGATSANVFSLDLNDQLGVSQYLANLSESGPHVDLAILAHGELGLPERDHNDPSAAAKLISINFTSYVNVLIEMKKLMLHQGTGNLFVLSSVAGDRGRKSNYLYGSTKAALNSFLQGLRAELFSAGIRVVTFKLGPVETRMTFHLKNLPFVAQPEDIAKRIIQELKGRGDIVYLPGVWHWVMLVIKLLPERIAKRLNF